VSCPSRTCTEGIIGLVTTRGPASSKSIECLPASLHQASYGVDDHHRPGPDEPLPYSAKLRGGDGHPRVMPLASHQTRDELSFYKIISHRGDKDRRGCLLGARVA
jgi:hypothetical protein